MELLYIVLGSIVIVYIGFRQGELSALHTSSINASSIDASSTDA